MPLARREFLALGAVGVAAATAGVLFGVLGLRPEGGGAESLLEQPFADLDGKIVQLRDWSSPVLLCNFWATWCAPCRKEVPLLVAARQQYAAKGLEIAGIGIDQVENLRQFAKEFGISYPVLVAQGDVSALLAGLGDRAAALPYSVLLDAKRRITYRKLGVWSEAEIEREIKAAIG